MNLTYLLQHALVVVLAFALATEVTTQLSRYFKRRFDRKYGRFYSSGHRDRSTARMWDRLTRCQAIDVSLLDGGTDDLLSG